MVILMFGVLAQCFTALTQIGNALLHNRPLFSFFHKTTCSSCLCPLIVKVMKYLSKCSRENSTLETLLLKEVVFRVLGRKVEKGLNEGTFTCITTFMY